MKKNTEIMKEKLNPLLKTKGIELISFEYYKQIFGNMALVVKKGGSIYRYITDRGEIYCNKKMLCDNSYMRLEQKKTFDKLLEFIDHQFNDVL